MKPMKRMQWMGIAVGVAGAVLMVYSGPFSHAWMSAHLPTGSPLRLNWPLLIGVMALIGGGLLVQTTWESQRR